jgi:hypothetical protein
VFALPPEQEIGPVTVTTSATPTLITRSGFDADPAATIKVAGPGVDHQISTVREPQGSRATIGPADLPRGGAASSQGTTPSC